MKLSPLFFAAALAVGASAFAQAGHPAGPSDRHDAGAQHSRADDGRTLGQRTRDAMARAGDATKRAFKRGKSEAQEATHEARRKGDRGDTSVMGAAEASRGIDGDSSLGVADADGHRRQRMDAAYANWKSQQPAR